MVPTTNKTKQAIAKVAEMILFAPQNSIFLAKGKRIQAIKKANVNGIKTDLAKYKTVNKTTTVAIV